ncbi:MAG: CHASE2 domain-containing protein [Candidatus Omnitrophica bacterium]|nr:CHASE2 domain-containing protein [Candidatus Omnitrophota bacterium]
MEKDPLYLLKRPVFSVLLVLVITTLYIHLQVSPGTFAIQPLIYPKFKLQDAFFKARLLYNERFRKGYPKESAVVLIASDEESVSKINDNQYTSYDPRFLARLITRISECQPKVIVLDIGFFNYGNYEGRPELIEAIKKAGNVFVVWDSSGMGTPGRQFDEDIMNASLGYGRVDITPAATIDNVIRVYYPSGYLKEGVGRVLPLALQAALAYKDMPFNIHYYDPKTNTILFMSKEYIIGLPLNEEKMTYINFLYDEKMIPTIPIWKAMEENLDPALLKGKIALVGMTAKGYNDFHLTPIGRIPGPIIMANQMNTFVHFYMFREYSNRIEALALVILGFLLTFLFYRRSMVEGFIVLIGTICASLAASFTLFLLNFLWSAWDLIALSLLLYLAILIHKASIWEVENKMLRTQRS